MCSHLQLKMKKGFAGHAAHSPCPATGKKPLTETLKSQDAFSATPCSTTACLYRFPGEEKERKTANFAASASRQ
jgi:hypothetical protein